VFSLPLKDAADLRRSNKGSEKIYAEVWQRVEAGTAALEEFVVLRTRLAGKGSTNSVEEYCYPTEYDPAELPNYIGQLDPRHDTSGVSTPSNPTSYEKRDLGMTVEVQFREKTSPDAIAVHLEANRVALKGRNSWGKEKSTAEVPQFEVQGIDRVLKLKMKKPVLVGSMSPAYDHHAKDRNVWLFFVTGSPLPPRGSAKGDQEKAERESQASAVWEVVCEVYSMPRSQAVAFQKSGRADGELVDLVGDEKVRLEHFFAARLKDDQESRLREAMEMAYPTEFDPPELPNSVNDLTGRANIEEQVATEANPTSYETKDVGAQLALTLSRKKGDRVFLSSTLEFVRYLGRVPWGQGKAAAEMPRFTAQRLVAQLEVIPGESVLLGTISPPEPLQPTDEEPRVWFVLMTVLEAKK
jgi:hypothetical protein